MKATIPMRAKTSFSPGELMTRAAAEGLSIPTMFYHTASKGKVLYIEYSTDTL